MKAVITPASYFIFSADKSGELCVHFCGENRGGEMVSKVENPAGMEYDKRRKS